jgi:hypothetical protein
MGKGCGSGANGRAPAYLVEAIGLSNLFMWIPSFHIYNPPRVNHPFSILVLC